MKLPWNRILLRSAPPELSLTRRWVELVSFTLVGLVIVSLSAYLNTYFPIHSETVVLYAILTTAFGIRFGFLPALIIAVTCLGASTWIDLYVTSVRPGFLFQIVELLLYLGGGILGSAMAAENRAQAGEAVERNRNLALLVETTAILNTLDLQSVLPQLAEKIVRGLSFSCCRICLFDPDRRSMATFAAFPVRHLKDFQEAFGEHQSLDTLPWHQEVISTRRRLMVRIEDLRAAPENPEKCAFFFVGLHSACLIPLIVEDRVIAVLSVGEARAWEREPITPQKIELLEAIAGHAAVMIHNASLHQTTRKQIERMQVLNQIARDLSATLELDDVMERTYRQINRVIPAETYFIALFDPELASLDLRVIIDEGRRFPPLTITLENSLAGWVATSGKPLLVRNMRRERDHLPIKPSTLGQDKQSAAWLGVPMVSDERVIGVLVVASYTENAFTEEDAALLGTVANQAALALENARNFAEVQERSRRDSLTGVLNHGYFIQRLSKEVEKAQAVGGSLALIMLDIDFFKKYNDIYGHILGDQVLNLTAQAIQKNIKSTDLVGRWGGEEFSIALPGANTLQAMAVSERIRATMARLPLLDKSGKPLPKPTVSQGIASYPEHAADSNQLVDLADRMLYGAKRGGRDQVHVFDGSLEPLDPSH